MTYTVGRRGKIQSAWNDWKLTTSTHSLNDGIYAAVIEDEAPFDGLQAAIDSGLIEFASTPHQDFVEVLYHAIERAQRLAQSTWEPTTVPSGAMPYSRRVYV
jgi:hypothetical protein